MGGQRDAAADRRLPNLERPANGGDAVLTRLHLEVERPRKPVHRESQLVAVIDQPDDRRAPAAAERFDAGEIYGGFDAWVVTGAGQTCIGIDGNVRLALAHVRREGGHQSSIGQQRRKDTASKLTKLVEGGLRLRGQAVQRSRSPHRILGQQAFCISEPSSDRFKATLNAVTNLAFDALLFGLPSSHDAVARCA